MCSFPNLSYIQLPRPILINHFVKKTPKPNVIAYNVSCIMVIFQLLSVNMDHTTKNNFLILLI